MYAASGGVCNLSNVEGEEDIDVIEEIFISINEEVDRDIKHEEIPRDITFPDIKSEADEVSYICMSGIRHILPVSRNLFFFFFGDVSIPGQLKQLHCWE